MIEIVRDMVFAEIAERGCNTFMKHPECRWRIFPLATGTFSHD